MQCAAETGTYHVPNPLVSELPPVVGDHLNAAINGLLGKLENFPPHFMLVSYEGGHGMIMHCEVEVRSVDSLRGHEVSAAEEELQVWIWIAFFGLDSCQ